MSTGGDAFIDSIGKPDIVKPNGISFKKASGRLVWETHTFLSGTGIDLDIPSAPSIPTIADIKHGLNASGMTYQECIDKNNEQIFLNAEKYSLHPYLKCSACSDDSDEAGMLEIGRGTDLYLLIDFLQHLDAASFGRFLYYCDSGQMVVIDPNEDNETLYNKMLQ